MKQPRRVREGSMRRVGRRQFLRGALSAAGGAWAASHSALAGAKGADVADPPPDAVPSYLKGYETLYRRDPRAAAIEWFRAARFGLFMHYGLYSLLGRHEWVQFREKVPVAEYAKLKDEFTAAKFDADFITDLALAAGMRYVNITTRHHDSFCLFRTNETLFSAAESPAGRDLVAELAEACRAKGLGLFFYYSYAADWRHPYFMSREVTPWDAARPAYETPQPEYKFEKDADFARYIAFVHAQLRELLTGYGPVAGIWLDPIMGYYGRPDLFPIRETYALVRSLQPQVLISFKQGACGEEDFVAPERQVHGFAEKVKKRFPESPASHRAAAQAWETNQGKPREICTTLQTRGWGYTKRERHRDADWVIEQLASARKQDANLLLNSGPLGDGSIHRSDVRTLRDVGRRLRRS